MARTAEEDKELESIKLQFYSGDRLPPSTQGPNPPAASAAQSVGATAPVATSSDVARRPPQGPEVDTGINDAYEAAPDWYDMPELAFLQAPGKNLLARFSTAFTNNPNQIGEILKTQFPGVKVEADKDFPKYMKFTSPTDGKTYFWKPGTHMNDLARGAFAAGVGGAATAAATAAAPYLAASAGAIPVVGPAIQAGVTGLGALEAAAGAGSIPAAIGSGAVAGASQAALNEGAAMLGGATPDVKQIPLGGAFGGAMGLGGRVAGTVYNGMRNAPVGDAVMGGIESMSDEALSQAYIAAREAGPAGKAAVETIRSEWERRLAGGAATGGATQGIKPIPVVGGSAPLDVFQHGVDAVRKQEQPQLADDLVARMGVDPKVADAERGLGIQLDPELRANLANPDAAKTVKMFQGVRASDAATSKAVQDAVVGKAAGDTVEAAKRRFGASMDRGAYAQELAGKLDQHHGALSDAAEKAWNTDVLKKKPIERPEEFFTWIDSMTTNPDKFPKLMAIKNKLSRSQERGPDGKLGKVYQPDWAVLDSVYKEAQNVARQKGAFSDWSSAEQGLAKEIVNKLRPAYERTFEKHAGKGALDAARAATQAVKRFEGGTDRVLGKRRGPNIEGHPFDYLEPALKDLSDGDPTTLVSMVRGIDGIGPDVQSDMVMTGLMSKFSDAGKGQPLNWTEAAKFGRKVRSQSFSEQALKSTLRPDQWKGLNHIFDVADNIDKVMAMRARTGNAVETRRALRSMDSSMNLLLDTAAAALPGTGSKLGGAVGGISGYFGGGAGVGLAAGAGGSVIGGAVGRFAQKALTRNRATPVDHLMDQWMASPAYSAGIKASAGLVPATPGLIQRIGEHPATVKWLEAAGVPPSERQRWIETFVRPAVDEAASPREFPDQKEDM